MIEINLPIPQLLAISATGIIALWLAIEWVAAKDNYRRKKLAKSLETEREKEMARIAAEEAQAKRLREARLAVNGKEFLR